jgi:hypothetical protein
MLPASTTGAKAERLLLCPFSAGRLSGVVRRAQANDGEKWWLAAVRDMSDLLVTLRDKRGCMDDKGQQQEHGSQQQREVFG